MYAEIPPRAEYSLTSITALAAWGSTLDADPALS
jgi:hypothetical protein